MDYSTPSTKLSSNPVTSSKSSPLRSRFSRFHHLHYGHKPNSLDSDTGKNSKETFKENSRNEDRLNLDSTELLLRTSDPFWEGQMGVSQLNGDPSSSHVEPIGIIRQEMFALPRDDSIIRNFMKLHSCYDLIPTSGKMLVFDTGLAVGKAFLALVYNGVRAAPLWDSAAQSFVGMLTITDFINVLRTLHDGKDGSDPSTVLNLEDHKIQTWRDEFLKEHRRPFLWVDPRVDLLRAARLLVKNKVHRLPVLDPVTGNALYILTHKRILRFLCLYIDDLLPRPRYMDRTLEELNIGSYTDIQTVFEDTPVHVALSLFSNPRRVSALPVLSRDGSERVVDVYAKFDVINLAAERSYRKLDITVKEALSYRAHVIEGVHSCQRWEKLGPVVDRIVKAGVHRLVVVDDNWKCVGMLSLSDILSFLIKPTRDIMKLTSNET